MAESFIDQVRKGLEKQKNAFEDYLVAGELEHAKNLIRRALEQGKNGVTWTYGYDSYDSYTTEASDLYGPLEPEPFENPRDAGILSSGGLGDYLGRFLDKEARNALRWPPAVDYAYTAARLEEGLRALGCKTVRLAIGPRTQTFRRQIRKGSVFRQEAWEEISSTVEQWVVSVSW